MLKFQILKSYRTWSADHVQTDDGLVGFAGPDPLFRSDWAPQPVVQPLFVRDLGRLHKLVPVDRVHEFRQHLFGLLSGSRNCDPLLLAFAPAGLRIATVATPCQQRLAG